VTDLAQRCLMFIQIHGPVATRDIFENGPAPSLKEAERTVRALCREGLVIRTETDRGGFAGWMAP
jgi:hypothetical protein